MLGVAPGKRMEILAERRREKMARSAHAYVRGNTLRFYEWLEAGAGKDIPEGPAVWICGDCHVGNLGPIANSDGRVEIQIRDLDQTVIGNPAHDLIRLGLSLATAARGSDLPGVTTAKMLERMVEAYERALWAPGRKSEEKEENLRPITTVLERSYRRRWEHLAQERIEDVSPMIPLGERFWALKKEEREAIDELFEDKAVAKVVTSLKGREEGSKLRVLDAAYWMKGCSSLGRLRYAVLLGVGKKKDRNYCLIDLKEATGAAAPRAEEYATGNHAQRVVAGACHLSPYLGERMMAVQLLRRPIVLRELMPQDLKFDLDHLTRDEAVAAAGYLAAVVGKAHGRQMDRKTCSRWRAELKKHRSKSLDAPGWLWTSVVDLVANHEVGYLEHCRRYASA